MIDDYKKYGTETQARQLRLKSEFGGWFILSGYRQCNDFEWVQRAADPLKRVISQFSTVSQNGL